MRAKTQLEDYLLVANDSIDTYQDICHSKGYHLKEITRPVRVTDVMDRLDRVDEVQAATHRTDDQQKLVSLERDLHNLKVELEENR